MNRTYRELVEGDDVLRFRGWEEAGTILASEKRRCPGEWSLKHGVLVVEDPDNDWVCRFEDAGNIVHMSIFERVVRESMGRRRMHDDRCRLLYRVKVRKSNLHVTVTEDTFEQECSARKRTLEQLSSYADLLDEDEMRELKQSLDPKTLPLHRALRDKRIRRSVRMIDAMMNLLGDEGAVEERTLADKPKPFSPSPLRPACRLFSIRRSYVRHLRKKGVYSFQDLSYKCD